MYQVTRNTDAPARQLDRRANHERGSVSADYRPIQAFPPTSSFFKAYCTHLLLLLSASLTTGSCTVLVALNEALIPFHISPPFVWSAFVAQRAFWEFVGVTALWLTPQILLIAFWYRRHRATQALLEDHEVHAGVIEALE